MRVVCEKDGKNITSTSSKLEKCLENPTNEENENQLSKIPRVSYDEFENSLECDVGKHPQIWKYPSNKLDEMYLK